jgi:hypothetical protein
LLGFPSVLLSLPSLSLFSHVLSLSLFCFSPFYPLFFFCYLGPLFFILPLVLSKMSPAFSKIF